MILKLKWSKCHLIDTSMSIQLIPNYQFVCSINTLVLCWSTPTFRQQRPLTLTWNSSSNFREEHCDNSHLQNFRSAKCVENSWTLCCTRLYIENSTYKFIIRTKAELNTLCFENIMCNNMLKWIYLDWLAGGGLADLNSGPGPHSPTCAGLAHGQRL